MADAVCERALELALAARPDVVDITGGSPELYPRLAEMILTLSDAGLAVRVRTNLVSLLARLGRASPTLFAEHGVSILARSPRPSGAVFEAQRGAGHLRSGARRTADAERARLRRGGRTRTDARYGSISS